MTEALSEMRAGRHPGRLLDFAELRRIVGFEAYDAEAAGYAAAPEQGPD